MKIAVISRDPAAPSQGPGRTGGGEEAARPAGRRAAAEVDAAAVIGHWFPLPDKYESIETSGLTTTLSTGSNQFDIALQ